MTSPRLPRRLRVALQLLPDGARSVADVGAGHGALAFHLGATVTRVIATELRSGPYAELCRNLGSWDAAANIETRLGPGLHPLAAGEVDAAVLAGTSARTALAISELAPAKSVRWLVLQCMQGSHQVEPWLQARAWRVAERSDVADRRRVYPTWLVEVAA